MRASACPVNIFTLLLPVTQDTPHLGVAPILLKSFVDVVVTEDSQGRQIAGLGFLEESVEVDVEVVQSRNIVLYIVVVFPVDGGHVV